MKGKARHLQWLILMTLVQPLAVEAHPFHWATESLGFVGGLLHPLTSIEHMLIMLAVGLWMSQSRERWVYFTPLGFVAAMLLGCRLTLISIEITHAELIAVSSASMLGLLLILNSGVSWWLGSLMIAVVALFHGYVHAYDIWLEADAVAYTAGFAVATLVLIAAGIGARRLFDRLALKSFSGKFSER